MKPSKMSNEYNLGNDYVKMKASTIVSLNEHFTVFTPDGPIDLKVDIKADFDGIPSKYHEVFMNVLTSKYINKVSYGDNPFSMCKPLPKKRWYQFWKLK